MAVYKLPLQDSLNKKCLSSKAFTLYLRNRGKSYGTVKKQETQTVSAEKSKQQLTTPPLTLLRDKKPAPRPQGRPVIPGEKRLSVLTLRQACGTH